MVTAMTRWLDTDMGEVTFYGIDVLYAELSITMCVLQGMNLIFKSWIVPCSLCSHASVITSAEVIDVDSKMPSVVSALFIRILRKTKRVLEPKYNFSCRA